MLRNITVTTTAVDSPLLQPRRRSRGMVISRLTRMPIQPDMIVCTRKVIKPPAIVPRIRPRAARRLFSSWSSMTKVTASSGYQAKAMRSKCCAIAQVIRMLNPSLRLCLSRFPFTDRRG